MGYPGDEGGGPPDSRLDTPDGRGSGPLEGVAGRGSGPRERTRSGSHRRPAADSRPGSTGSYPGTTTYAGTTEYPGSTGSAAVPAPPTVAGGPPSRENAWRRPDRRPGQEIQGGPGSTPAGGGSPSRGSLWNAGAFRTAGPGGRGPVRGFPPAPGAPDPVYPPGQFSPWNAPALRTVGAAGRPGLAAGSGPDPSEPGYSLLAVSDPSADATATQTWAVLDDALLGEWSAAPARSGPGESPPPGAGEGAQDGPRGFFEPVSEPPAPSGPAAPPGYADHAVDPDGGPGHPGDAGYAGQTDPSLSIPRPGGRLAARQGLQEGTTDTQAPDTAAAGTRGSRSAARGRRPRKPRRPPSRARMWLMPLVMMVVVIAGITVAYLHFAQRQARPPAAAPARPATASGSASPSLGPWQHITTRADDPKALSLAELFPTRYTAGGTVVRTIQRSGRNCPKTVLGNRLGAALRKAGCTQVMRASYLSAGQKIMATVGVLNLASVTGAEHAGKATGATAFIKQLPAAHGPTRNLMKGTGLEEAQIKGHYLILTWAEFTNLKAPGSAARRTELDTFSRQLVTSTAGISLTSRMVFGKPQIP
jgi:hypothetical protein